jgi:hypothetical protein
LLDSSKAFNVEPGIDKQEILKFMLVPRFELIFGARGRKQTNNKRVGGNRHDNKAGKYRLRSHARVLWLGRYRS